MPWYYILLASTDMQCRGIFFSIVDIKAAFASKAHKLDISGYWQSVLFHAVSSPSIMLRHGFDDGWDFIACRQFPDNTSSWIFTGISRDQYYCHFSLRRPSGIGQRGARRFYGMSYWFFFLFYFIFDSFWFSVWYWYDFRFSITGLQYGH